jgi:hypothetical protein
MCIQFVFQKTKVVRNVFRFGIMGKVLIANKQIKTI